ncbi:MAG: hypothetical protein RL380_419, partial [Verrucomicrobiota bacterium]
MKAPLKQLANRLTPSSTLITAIIVLATLAFGFDAQAATYTWVATSGSAPWTTSTSWTPTRTTPNNADILLFSGGGSVTATAVPAQTVGKLQVSGNTTVTLQAGAASVFFQIGAAATDSLTVAAGSQLNISGANVLQINLNTTAKGSISGSMTFAGAANQLLAADASAITFNSGATFTADTGNTGNPFGSSGTANTVIFASGSTFIQNAGSNPFGLGQPSSKVTFQAGSLYKMQVNSAPSLSGRTYANLEINATGFSQSGTGTAALSIDNLTMTVGVLNLNLTAGIAINGNISVASSQTLTFSPASANTLTFGGTGTQVISGAGTLTFAANTAVVVGGSST